MNILFYNLGKHAALESMGVDSREGIGMGHQEAHEEDDPRPRQFIPLTLATSGSKRSRGSTHDIISRAFDTHDSITPRDTPRPTIEYVG